MFLCDGEAGCCSVAAEFPDQVEVPLGDQIECIAQMQSGDGAAGSFQLAILTTGERDSRAMKLIFELARDQTDYTLVPVRFEHNQAIVIARIEALEFGECGFLHCGLNFTPG